MVDHRVISVREPADVALVAVSDDAVLGQYVVADNSAPLEVVLIEGARAGGHGRP